MPMTRESTVGMTDAEWRAARMGSLGGSDAACFVGLNPYKSPYTLWAEKTGAVPEADLEENESVRMGRYLEQYIADRFTEETGIKVRRENAILRNSDYPFAHANVDRMVVGEKEGLECKYTDSMNLRQYKNGLYPERFYVQCVHYLMVTGYKVWHLAVLCGSKFMTFRIARDEEEIASLARAEQEYWELVKTKTPPPVDGFESTGKTLTQLSAASANDDPIPLLGVDDVIQSIIAMKEQKKVLEHSIREAENTIKEQMAENTYGATPSYKIRWTPYITRRFNKARFYEDHPEISLEDYHTETLARRFEIKEIS